MICRTRHIPFSPCPHLAPLRTALSMPLFSPAWCIRPTSRPRSQSQHPALPRRADGRYGDTVWTVLPNFDCRASDGTTPASRFFRHAFPDLFETVLANIDDVPRPRSCILVLLRHPY